MNEAIKLTQPKRHRIKQGTTHWSGLPMALLFVLCAILSFGGCASSNEDSAEEELFGSGFVSGERNAVDDSKLARKVMAAEQTEDLSQLTITLRVGENPTLCDLVGVEADYSFQHDADAEDPELVGKRLEFTADFGRLKPGERKEVTVTHTTVGTIVTSGIRVEKVYIRDIQACEGKYPDWNF